MAGLIRTTLLTLAALPVCAAGQGLAELEALASESAADVRLADVELQVLEQRLRATEAEAGPRAFGSAALNDTTEAITDTASRDYRRAALQAGVRWPLLGGREAQERARLRDGQALQQAQWQREAAREQVRRLVRLAYVDAHHHQRRTELARAFLHLQPQAEDVLRQRTQARLLYESDRLAFVSMFDTARRELVRHQSLHVQAVAALSRLTGRPLPGWQAQPPLPDAACLSPQALYAAVEHRPAVRAARSGLEAAEQMRATTRWHGVDAGVSVSQSLTRDIRGPSGRSTGVAIDVNLPLGWRAVRDARRAEERMAIERARLQLDAARADHAAAVDAALTEQSVLAQDLVGAQRQLRGAQEASRIARLRAEALDGDVLERELQARYALFQAAQLHEDSLHRQARQQVQLLSLSTHGCPPMARADSIAPLAAALALPLRGGTPEPDHELSWFVWRSAPWLEAPQQLDQLPPGTRRLFVSLDAAQLAALRQPAGAGRLHTFLAAARQRGLQVHLLLGEPTWVMPAHRAPLLAIVEQVRGFGFDALNLDLERSQLAPEHQPQWSNWTLDTLRAVAQRAPWPVVLTTHHRDLRDARYLRALRSAGVSEVVAMIYASSVDTTWRTGQALLDDHHGMPVSIAQSIERELDPQESHWHHGRAEALQRWQQLAERWADTPGFAGIAVQSLESFREAPP